MSLAKYEIFNKVVECKSLSKAGEQLNLTQSAVSHAILNLEKEFGFPLLTRSRSGISLTNEGEKILEYIRELLLIHEKMKQEVASINGMELGTVRIGTFMSVSANWLPDIINEFQRDYPHITLELFEGNYKEIENWLAAGEIDCGFVTIPSNEAFHVRPLKKDPMVCILSKNHPFADQEYILFKQIEAEPFIMQKVGCDNDVRRIFQQYNIQPQVKYEFADDHAIISMVKNNHGISILPEMVLPERTHNLAVLPLEHECFREIGIASAKNIAPATNKFIHCVTTWISKANTLNFEKNTC